jgi:hypothetical protein
MKSEKDAAGGPHNHSKNIEMYQFVEFWGKL